MWRRGPLLKAMPLAGPASRGHGRGKEGGDSPAELGGESRLFSSSLLLRGTPGLLFSSSLISNHPPSFSSTPLGKTGR